MVVLCPDTGRNYLSKFHDDAWMAENHLLGADPVAETVGDLLRTRGRREPSSHRSRCLGRRGRRADAGQRDLAAPGPSQTAEAVGSIQEVTLARLLHDGSDPARVRVGDIMARPLPQLDVAVHLDEAYRLLLAGNSGVLATAGGSVVDIITRIDLITYWNRPVAIEIDVREHFASNEE